MGCGPLFLMLQNGLGFAIRLIFFSLLLLLLLLFSESKWKILIAKEKRIGYNPRPWPSRMLLLMLGNGPWNCWFHHQGGITWWKRLSVAPNFNARGWAVDHWFCQVCHLIKEGLPGREDLSMALTFNARRWAMDCWFQQVHDSTKSATSSRRAYLAE